MADTYARRQVSSRYGWWMSILLAVGLLPGLIPRQGWAQPQAVAPEAKARKWHGIHLLGYFSDAKLESLARDLPKLAKLGINLIVLEVDYHFDFKSHPELRQSDHPITAAGAQQFVAAARQQGIRVIPQFQCIGHQSWAGETFPLLTKYPQFDLTPGAFPKNKGLYCREWDVTNPEVNKIVFKLMDEIIEGFDADALHIGADEIFLLGSEHSPATKGQDPAKLFAKAINDFHGHLVKQRKVEMLMWGDRLIDAKRFHWGEWEASACGTAAAVDRIPKDIIICPWHYEPMPNGYPSIPMFLDKGFRVLPASWHKLDAMKQLVESSYQHDSPQMLGHLFTTWENLDKTLTTYAPMVEGMKLIQTLESR